MKTILIMIMCLELIPHIMGKGNSSEMVIPGDDNKVYVQSFEGYDSCTVIEAVSMTGNISP